MWFSPAFLALCAMNFVWGASYAVSKWVLLFVPPCLLAATRFVLGGAVLFLFVPRGSPPLERDDWRDLLVVGTFGISVNFVIHYWGLKLTTATKASFLIATEPLALIVLAALMLREKASRSTFVALSISMAGTFSLLVGGKNLDSLWGEISTGGELLGDILTLGSVLLGTLYTIFSKHVAQRIGALRSTGFACLLGGFFLVPFGIWELATGKTAVFSAGVLAGIAFLSFLCTAFGYVLWNWVLIRIPASDMAVSLNLQPLGGLLVGIFWLGESLNPGGWIGAILILIGVAVLPKPEETTSPPGIPTPPLLLQETPAPTPVSSEDNSIASGQMEDRKTQPGGPDLRGRAPPPGCTFSPDLPGK